MTNKEFIELLLSECPKPNKLKKEEKECYENLLKIKQAIEEYIIIKQFVLERTAFYDNGMCLDEYIYDEEPIAKIFRKWEKEDNNHL